MLPRAVRLEQRVPVLLLGNWATDLDGGSSFGYTLLIVVLLANFCAMFLQGLCLKLGIVAERLAGAHADLQTYSLSILFAVLTTRMATCRKLSACLTQQV